MPYLFKGSPAGSCSSSIVVSCEFLSSSPSTLFSFLISGVDPEGERGLFDSLSANLVSKLVNLALIGISMSIMWSRRASGVVDDGDTNVVLEEELEEKTWFGVEGA